MILTHLHFQYELVRSSSVLKNQALLLQSLALPHSHLPHPTTYEDILASILETVDFYEQKVIQAGASTADDGICIIAREVEANGLHGAKSLPEAEAP